MLHCKLNKKGKSQLLYIPFKYPNAEWNIAGNLIKKYDAHDLLQICRITRFVCESAEENIYDILFECFEMDLMKQLIQR